MPKTYYKSPMPILIFLIIFLSAFSAEAYIGPGLGSGVIGVVLGILAAIVLAVVGVIWYPLKRVLKKRSGAQKEGPIAKNKGQGRSL